MSAANKFWFYIFLITQLRLSEPFSLPHVSTFRLGSLSNRSFNSRSIINVREHNTNSFVLRAALEQRQDERQQEIDQLKFQAQCTRLEAEKMSVLLILDKIEKLGKKLSSKRNISPEEKDAILSQINHFRKSLN